MTVLRDLRHSARMLLANPGFSLIAILSIAMGVGVNTTMFSMADGLILRPLAVERPSEVVTLATVSPDGILPRPVLSYPDYLDIRARARSFASLVVYREVVTAFD